MIHLDTSFLIRALASGSAEDGTLRRWLADGRPLGISVIAWTEFLCGPVAAHQAQLAARLVSEPAAFGTEESALAARLFNLSGRRRGSLLDCMVAAAAVRAGAALATANPADFRRLEAAGLEVVTG